MRAFSALGCSLLAILAVPACGGDDDGVDIVDAGDDDGGGSGADAGAGGNNLGVACSSEPKVDCPTDTPICISLQGSTEGFCSRGCATTPEPPAGEDPELPGEESFATCIDGYDGPGVPACRAPLPAMGGQIPWVCILACGSTPDVEFGDCPKNLTCDQPDPAANGFCVPPG